QQNVEAISNSTLQSSDNMGAPVQSSGFLGAPQPLASGVLESNQPPASAPAVTAAPASAAPAAASPTQTAAGYVVQVGALNDPARAQQLMKSLSQRYGVPGTVETAGNVYRVQLGGYPTRAEAAALQQRLSSDGQNASFITNTRR
ncbi:MAG: SPOR domain-containing protein, partial [Pantoea sp.]|nr:SPOR domain-containing protein [Pantoea sp.]